MPQRLGHQPAAHAVPEKRDLPHIGIGSEGTEHGDQFIAGIGRSVFVGDIAHHGSGRGPSKQDRLFGQMPVCRHLRQTEQRFRKGLVVAMDKDHHILPRPP